MTSADAATGAAAPADGESPAGGVRAAAMLRPARADDVPACLDVFYEAGEELHRRQGLPILPRNPAPLGRLFEHLIGTDPERAWVASMPDGTLVGFGLAHRRGTTWFLAFLFVRPAHQATGLGRRLLDACLGDARDGTVATCIESIQPVSAGLYATFGMLPQVPQFVMTGQLRGGARLVDERHLELVPFPSVPGGTDAAIDGSVAAIDRETLGYDHGDDHRFWVAMERRGHLFRDPRTGATVGYGYVAASGRIGPVAAVDQRWLPEMVQQLFEAIPTPGAWLLFVPGPSVVLEPLLRAGLRFDGPPAIWCGNARPPAFERYLVGNFAVL